MSVRLAPAVVDSLLLGPEDRRRQLQELPILGDVWTRFADEPGELQDLLIIPTRETRTGDVVDLVSRHHAGDKAEGCSVAYLQDLVVASFELAHVYQVLLPATSWWDHIQDDWGANEPGSEDLGRWIRLELFDALGKKADAAGVSANEKEIEEFAELKTAHRQAAKLGLLLGVFVAAGKKRRPAAKDKGADTSVLPPQLNDLLVTVRELKLGRIVEEGRAAVQKVIASHKWFAANEIARNGVIFQVTLNRVAEHALAESVPAIKADAARNLFSINCGDIAWAVLDSGIDEKHPAFWDRAKIRKAEEKAAREAEEARKKAEKEKGSTPAETAPDMQAADATDKSTPQPSVKRPHRIKATFEFRKIRAILGVRTAEIEALAADIARQSALGLEKVKELLTEVAADRVDRKPVDWHKIRDLITLDLENGRADRPEHPHGTHVAGIIGADWPEQKIQGVCPDIVLYDFRVIGSTLGDSEFAVSAALQFIRFLNEQSGTRIHGINMSLAIRHNVRNYACGRTPVCNEAEALVANGVVVVAAAGNRGYQSYQLSDSTTFESYAASSITDPGNAEGVITVGATHRQWPHTYGVSFFSSRGPTGDGRMKPDLLAPGEKIVSCIPNGRQDQMDGTSMAAPHVSGAAALLMARHKELKGQPARIKEILCSTATDLKRERSFQGHGMVDVLRAIQSI